MNNDWYCQIDETEYGPLSPQDLKRMAKTGQLGPKDLVRKSEAGKWIPASQIKGLVFETSPKAVAREAEQPAEILAERTCPSCQAVLQAKAVICVNCGLDLRTGKPIAKAMAKKKTGPPQTRSNADPDLTTGQKRTGEAVERPLNYQEHRSMETTPRQTAKSGLLITSFSVIVVFDLLPWYYVTYSGEGSGAGLTYTIGGNGVIFGLQVWWGIACLCFSLVGLAASIWTPRNTMRGASIAVSIALIGSNILGFCLIFAGIGLPLDLPAGAQRPSRLTVEAFPIAPIPIVILAIVALIRAKKLPREEPLRKDEALEKQNADSDRKRREREEHERRRQALAAAHPPAIQSFSAEQLSRNAAELGEMYFDCPHCGHCERLNDVGKAIYKTNPFQFKDYACLKCKKKFDAAPRMNFGACPTSASSTTTTPNTLAVQVKFKKKWSKQNQFGLTDTYEEFSGPSEEAAKAYLNTRQITEAQYYLVVETPEGCWGKDRAGIYKE